MVTSVPPAKLPSVGYTLRISDVKREALNVSHWYTTKDLSLIILAGIHYACITSRNFDESPPPPPCFILVYYVTGGGCASKLYFIFTLTKGMNTFYLSIFTNATVCFLLLLCFRYKMGFCLTSVHIISKLSCNLILLRGEKANHLVITFPAVPPNL